MQNALTREELTGGGDIGNRTGLTRQMQDRCGGKEGQRTDTSIPQTETETDWEGDRNTKQSEQNQKHRKRAPKGRTRE